MKFLVLFGRFGGARHGGAASRRSVRRSWRGLTGDGFDCIGSPGQVPAVVARQGRGGLPDRGATT